MAQRPDQFFDHTGVMAQRPDQFFDHTKANIIFYGAELFTIDDIED